MTQTQLHVLVLYDLPEITLGHNKPDYLLLNSERPTERDVCRAIKKLGFKLSIFGVFDDVTAITRVVEQLNPDVIFNLCETFKGDRTHEGHLAGIFQMLGVPVTGSKAESLHLCKDKALTKMIASHEGIRVPKFTIVGRNDIQPLTSVSYPAIVKPIDREASEGIAKASVVQDPKMANERVKFLHESLHSDAIVEEFIHGREIYIGVIETSVGIAALPPRELFMEELHHNQPMVATYKAKWDEDYRKRWGISTGKAKPLDEKTLKQLIDGSVKIFKTFKMSGYARIDWRVSEDESALFLEANPNPALAIDDDFAQAARTAGTTYQELIFQIICSAIDHFSQDTGIKSSKSTTTRKREEPVIQDVRAS